MQLLYTSAKVGSDIFCNSLWKEMMVNFKLGRNMRKMKKKTRTFFFEQLVSLTDKTSLSEKENCFFFISNRLRTIYPWREDPGFLRTGRWFSFLIDRAIYSYEFYISLYHRLKKINICVSSHLFSAMMNYKKYQKSTLQQYCDIF